MYEEDYTKDKVYHEMVKQTNSNIKHLTMLFRSSQQSVIPHHWRLVNVILVIKGDLTVFDN